jgi:hypothetical protein
VSKLKILGSDRFPFPNQNMSTPNPSATSASAEKPVLLEAINFTFRTLEWRLRMYRNLVTAVSLTGLGSVIVAVILRRWVVLVGELALPLYFAGFLFLDRRIVMAWRRGVFQMRDERGLNIAQLTKALSGFPHLPQATVRSLLAVLTSEKPQT